MNKKYIKRSLESRINKILKDHPGVIVIGAKQVGKTTLIKRYQQKGYKYVSFENPKTLTKAKLSPSKFLENLGNKIIIDEIHHYPDMGSQIKALIDTVGCVNGRFILASSFEGAGLRRIQSRLLWQVIPYRLLPMSQSEWTNIDSKFFDVMFNNKFIDKKIVPMKGKTLDERILSGGFYDLSKAKDKNKWTKNYINDLINDNNFDHKDKIISKRLFKKIITCFATHTNNFLNTYVMAKSINMDQKTFNKYGSYLRDAFLFHFNDKVVKLSDTENFGTPYKIHFTDTGLICGLLNITDLNKLKLNKPKFYKKLLVSFVYNELFRLSYETNDCISIHYYRNKKRTAKEVEFVFRFPNHNYACISVSTSETVNIDDFKGILDFQNYVGKRDFKAGVILYKGEVVKKFKKNLWAIPVHLLWEVDHQ